MTDYQNKTVQDNVINVPNVKAPMDFLCWIQDVKTMTRCDRRADHKGKHSWEHKNG